MSATLHKENKQFIRDYGEYLAAQYGRQFDYAGRKIEENNQAAVTFGNYLKSHRLTLGMPRLKFAEQVQVSEAELFALEHGMIPATKIEATTLTLIAEVLNEEVEFFEMLLERDIPTNKLEAVAYHGHWFSRFATAYFGSKAWAVVFILLTLLSFMGLALATLLEFFPDWFSNVGVIVGYSALGSVDQRWITICRDTLQITTTIVFVVWITIFKDEIHPPPILLKPIGFLRNKQNVMAISSSFVLFLTLIAFLVSSTATVNNTRLSASTKFTRDKTDLIENGHFITPQPRSTISPVEGTPVFIREGSILQSNSVESFHKLTFTWDPNTNWALINTNRSYTSFNDQRFVIADNHLMTLNRRFIMSEFNAFGNDSLLIASGSSDKNQATSIFQLEEGYVDRPSLFVLEVGAPIKPVNRIFLTTKPYGNTELIEMQDTNNLFPLSSRRGFFWHVHQYSNLEFVQKTEEHGMTVLYSSISSEERRDFVFQRSDTNPRLVFTYNSSDNNVSASLNRKHFDMLKVSNTPIPTASPTMSPTRDTNSFKSRPISNVKVTFTPIYHENHSTSPQSDKEFWRNGVFIILQWIAVVGTFMLMIKTIFREGRILYSRKTKP